MKFKLDKNYILLFLLVIFALALRLVNLDSLPVFADESIYIRWAQVIKNEPSLRFVPLSDGKPPLYMWVVWQALAFFNDPLVAGRVVSAVFGTLTIIGIYFVSHTVFKAKRAALMASVVYAISPLSLFFDRMALTDSMLVTFGVWTFYFSYLAVSLKRYDFAMLAGFTLGAAFLTKPPALFYALLLPSILVLVHKVNIKKVLASVKFLFPTYAITFGMYNILRLGPNFHMLSSRNHDYVYPYSHILTSPLNPLLSHLGAIWGYFWIWGPFTLLLLVVIGKMVVLKSKFIELVVVGLWAVIPFMIAAEFGKTMTARYILPVYPFIAVIAGLALYTANSKFVTKLATLAVLLFIGHALFINFRLITNVQAAPIPRSERSGYLEDWTAGVGIKEVANVIRQEAVNNPSTQIVVGAEGYFGTPFSALEFYLNGIPNVVVIGVGIGLTEVPESLVASKAVGNKTYLVINSTRLNTVFDEQEVLLLATYPKAQKPDGTTEEMYFFEIK